MSVITHDLWSLVLDRSQIDPAELAGAVEKQASQLSLDYRSRLLIRDSLDALARHWGPDCVGDWICRSPARPMLEQIWRSDLGPPGFPSLGGRIIEIVKPEKITQFLRDLGVHLRKPTRIDVGGSIALILEGKLSRRTEDIVVVDEVPTTIREEHELLSRLASRYGLSITHFQSHYLPSGWSDRRHWFGQFGRLTVSLVDSYDIFVGKLFSAREKDLDDLRELAPQLEKEKLRQRLRESANLLLADQRLAADAIRNWYILYGEPLPQ